LLPPNALSFLNKHIMDPAVRGLIEAIHAAPYCCVLAQTGGGTQAAAMLLNIPGGSRTILEVVIPYHEQALTEFLGHRPTSFCSAETVAAMAERAHARARWLVPGESAIGLGCTASLVSDRPKRGEHRLHVATCTELAVRTYTLTLTKGARDREAEENIVDGVILNALAAAMNIYEQVELPVLAGEELQMDATPASHPLARLLMNGISTFCVQSDGRQIIGAALPALLMSGSFNPVHAGHWQLAEAASRLTGTAAAFELSITNVDKPPPSAEEIRRRIAQFEGRVDLWLTRAPTFAEKAALFPGTTFVIGSDTAIRLVQPRYYDDSEERMLAALDIIRTRGCRFLVAGRVSSDGKFMHLDQINIPASHRALFTPIAESDFRADLSSTILRAGAAIPGTDAEG
jgi:hypothetical protein